MTNPTGRAQTNAEIAANDFLKARAQRISDRYGIGGKTIYPILKKTAIYCSWDPPNKFHRLPWMQAISEGLETIESPVSHIFFRPSIEDALKYLAPDEALRLFNSKRIQQLGKLEHVFHMYFTGFNAGLPIVEWEIWLPFLITFLEDNREHLVLTGYPRYRPPCFLSSWNYQLVSTLYPVRKPRLISLRKNLEGRLQYHYVWEFARADGSPQPQPELEADDLKLVERWGFDVATDGQYASPGGKPIPTTVHEEARLFEGLTTEDVSRIECERSQLLQVRIDVLTEMLHAVRNQNANEMFARCFNILENAINSEQALYYLRLDRKLYPQRLLVGAPPKSSHSRRRLTCRGFLWPLICLLREVELEMMDHATSKVFNSLSNFYSQGMNFRTRFLSFRCYFEALARWGNEMIDPVLEDFVESLTARTEPSRKIMERWNEAIRDDLHDEIVLKVKVRHKFANKLERHLSAFSEWSRAQLEITGDVPQLAISQAEEEYAAISQRDDLNEFRYGPDFRSVSHEGKEYTLTGREAEVIRILLDAYENGTPDVSSDWIIVQICGSESNIRRLRDLFSSRDAYKRLVRRGSRKGTYRLNR